MAAKRKDFCLAGTISKRKEYHHQNFGIVKSKISFEIEENVL